MAAVEVRDPACKYVPIEAPDDVVPEASFEEETLGTLLDVTLTVLGAEGPIAVAVETTDCGKTFATGTVAEGGAWVVTRYVLELPVAPPPTDNEFETADRVPVTTGGCGEFPIFVPTAGIDI